MDTSTQTSARPIPGRSILWIGLALGLAGPAIYIAETSLGRLATPWYLPILGIAGAGLTLVSWFRRRGVVRLVVALPLILLALAETTLVAISKLPAYAGPIAVGQPFPAFTTKLADNSPYTPESLKGNGTTAMVFFRGRW